jgi:FtsZ-interacting cell division protein YlmF
MASTTTQGISAPTAQDNTCATTARTADGTLIITYMPQARSVTVDMTKLSASATARWFDPTSGAFTTVAGSPLANTGTRMFTPPTATHSDGYNDWALVLETSPPN